jgi:hypothetical protein
VDEALGIGVLRVHRRIEPVVGDDPLLHRDEQLLAILIGELERSARRRKSSRSSISLR